METTTLTDVRKNTDLLQSLQMAKDIITKDYLHSLQEFEVRELPIELEELDIAEYVRLYRFEKFVTDKDESMLEKLVTVLNVAYASKATVVTVIRGFPAKMEYYLGIVSKDALQETQDVSTQGEVFRSALAGNYPGLCMESLDYAQIENLSREIFSEDCITSVSGLASFRNEGERAVEKYVQGLEHLVDSLEGREYNIVIIADPVGSEELEIEKRGYTTLYTQLSPFLQTTLNFSETDIINFTTAHTKGFSDTVGESSSMTQNYSVTNGWSSSSSHQDSKTKSMAGLITAGGIGVSALFPAAAPAVMAAALAVGPLLGSKTSSDTETTGKNGSTSQSNGRTIGRNMSQTNQESDTSSQSEGESRGRSIQFSNENHMVKRLLQKIDKNIERIERCEAFGAFYCAAYVISSDPETNAVVANGYNALMKGEQSALQSSYINTWSRSDVAEKRIKNYLKKFSHPVFYCTNGNGITVTPASLESSYEVAVNMGIPKKSVNGLLVTKMAVFGRSIFASEKEGKDDKSLRLGKLYHMGKVLENEPACLNQESLSMHTFITGSTGSGKSNTVYQLLHKLNERGVKFLVLEPAKGEYKHIFGQFADVVVYGTNPKVTELLKINPFRFPEGVHVLEHLDRLVEIFNVCWPMYAAMPAILKEAMERAYTVAGWNISTSENEKGEKYPNFADLLEQIENVINDSKYSADSKGDYSGALLTRVHSLTNGLNGQIFCSDDLPDSELFDKNVIVDLSRVGSTETKSLIMGLLVMKLNEYRMDTGKMNHSLSHVTVLEEAHNLLKRTSTEQSSEGANLLGKSVELLANSIAEMRTYGEGFIIADQSPGLLDMSVIRNTNTKIILRLPDRTDRELVGYAAGLNDEQIEELARLKQGVAAVYQNDWVEPVLVQIDKCEIEEKEYHFTDYTKPANLNTYRRQLINFLIQGRIDNPLEFDVIEIEKSLGLLGLSMRNQEFVEKLIAEHKETGSLELWQDNNFKKLSGRVADVLEIRNRVENFVLSAHDNRELTEALKEMILQIFPDVSREVVLTLSQCFMKDMSIQKDESEIRQNIYKNWIDSVRGTW